jgi:serine/threonine protein kinase
LKPENILWFKNRTNSSKIGTLKIGDWGLAKQHHDITQLRTVQTSTGFGTRRYEPPEERTVRDNNLIVPNDTGKVVRKRSRLYDLWAMGCIWLEFLIWLMYGLDGLKQFNRSFHQGQSDNPSYYELDRNDGAKVHHVALRWIQHMTQDPVCEVGQTALGDLLEFIRDRLLVVKLPRNLGSNIDMSNTPRARRRSSSSNDTIIGELPSRGIAASMDIPKITLNEPDPTENPAKENSPFSITISPPVSPPMAPQSDKGCRARAKDLYDRMEDIMTDVDTPKYWLSGTPLPPPDHAVEVSGRKHGPQSQPSTSRQATLSVAQSPSLALTEKVRLNPFPQ